MTMILGGMALLGIAASRLHSAVLLGIAVLLMAVFILMAPCCRHREKFWFFVLYSALMIPVHLLWLRDVVALVYLEVVAGNLYERLYCDVIAMALFSAELIVILMLMDLLVGRQRAVRAADEGKEKRAA